MPKLVILNASLAGRSQELAVDKTTIGRVEDNTFAIADPSVSSHHCEVLLRGNDVVPGIWQPLYSPRSRVSKTANRLLEFIKSASSLDETYSYLLPPMLELIA